MPGEGASARVTALSEMVRPGGLLLLGDGFWASEPSSAAIEIFGNDAMSLAALVEYLDVYGGVSGYCYLVLSR